MPYLIFSLLLQKFAGVFWRCAATRNVHNCAGKKKIFRKIILLIKYSRNSQAQLPSCCLYNLIYIHSSAVVFVLDICIGPKTSLKSQDQS